MNKELQFNTLKFGIPILIISFLALLPQTIYFQNAPRELSIGILLDLLITIPLLFCFLIKNTEIPKISIVYTFIVGIIVAGFIIPMEQQQLLSSIKFISIPLIEIGIISMLIYKIKGLSTSFKKTTGDDFYDKLLIACNEVFPNRLGKIMATEVAVAYYLFVSKKKAINKNLEFTYFKKSGIKSIIAVFLFLMSLETFILHILVSLWNPTVAWVLSIIGLYTMIQIFAQLKSMNKRLITINYETQSLKLRYGFGSQTLIPFKSIKTIEKSRKLMPNDKDHVCLSLFDFVDSSNIIIHLNDENRLDKLYGIEKKYTSISLFIDEEDLFVDKIEQLIVS